MLYKESSKAEDNRSKGKDKVAVTLILLNNQKLDSCLSNLCSFHCKSLSSEICGPVPSMAYAKLVRRNLRAITLMLLLGYKYRAFIKLNGTINLHVLNVLYQHCTYIATV